MATIVTEIPESFALTACPNCGYSLAGLARAGTCPECGRGYDQSALVLHGWVRGKHENLANAKRSRIAWVAVGAVASPMAWVLLQLLLAPRRHTGEAMAVIVCCLLPLAYLWFRRQNIVHPGLIQMRLNERECVQYDDLAGSSVVREGSIADVNAAYCRPTAWKDVGEISLLPVGSDSYRVRITCHSTFFPSDVVDAEIRCTSEQAQQLGKLLRGWKANARRTG